MKEITIVTCKHCGRRIERVWVHDNKQSFCPDDSGYRAEPNRVGG